MKVISYIILRSSTNCKLLIHSCQIKPTNPPPRKHRNMDNILKKKIQQSSKARMVNSLGASN